MAERRIRLQQPNDDILHGKVEKLADMKLQGWAAIKELTDELRKWDPRIVSEAVRSLPDWRDWVAADQQQQQQQQQQQ